MAYEVYSRKTSRVGTPMMTITKLGRVALNNAATARFQKEAVEYVLLLSDKENRRIGIRPITKKDPRAYQVAYGKKGNGAGFSAKTFLDYMELDYAGQSRSVPVEWNNDQNMYEAEFPAEFFKDSRQRKLIPVEATGKRTTSA
jgi:hypothetical protein